MTTSTAGLRGWPLVVARLPVFTALALWLARASTPLYLARPDAEIALTSRFRSSLAVAYESADSGRPLRGLAGTMVM